MGSRFAPSSYDEAMLLTLEQVFDVVCNTLNAGRGKSQLRTMVAQKLMELAAVGVIDPEELRVKTLKDLRH
jgi:hypothetical protein